MLKTSDLTTARIAFTQAGDRILTGIVVPRTRGTTAGQVQFALRAHLDEVWTISTASHNGVPPLPLLKAAQDGQLVPVATMGDGRGGTVGLYRVGDCLASVPRTWDPQRVWCRRRARRRGRDAKPKRPLQDVWAEAAAAHAYDFLYRHGYRRGDRVPRAMRIACVIDWLERRVEPGSEVTTRLLQVAAGLALSPSGKASPQGRDISRAVAMARPDLLRSEWLGRGQRRWRRVDQRRPPRPPARA